MSGTDQERQGVAALTDLFEEYYERITRYIVVRVGNQADAEELASDVFVRAVENIGSFQWRGVPLQACCTASRTTWAGTTRDGPRRARAHPLTKPQQGPAPPTPEGEWSLGRDGTRLHKPRGG